MDIRIQAANPNQPTEDRKPFAGLQQALEDGRLSVSPDDAPRAREYFHDYTGLSSVPREERIRLGMGSCEPEFRRTTPRD